MGHNCRAKVSFPSAIRCARRRTRVCEELKRQLRLRQRFTLAVVFALGVMVCGVALVQLPFIKRRQKHAMYFGSVVNVLVAIQISLAIVAASLPDLRALVMRVRRKREEGDSSVDSG